MTATIERAGVAHLDGWAALRAMLWPEGTPEQHRSEISDQLAAGGDTVAFVAIDGGIVIGFAEAGVRHDHVNGCDTSPAGFLEGIAVAPEHRRTGVARALVAAIEAWARSCGCTELGSDTNEANGEGQARHRHLGFEERERVVFYRKLLQRVPNGSTLS